MDNNNCDLEMGTNQSYGTLSISDNNSNNKLHQINPRNKFTDLSIDIGIPINMMNKNLIDENTGLGDVIDDCEYS